MEIKNVSEARLRELDRLAQHGLAQIADDAGDARAAIWGLIDLVSDVRAALLDYGATTEETPAISGDRGASEPGVRIAGVVGGDRWGGASEG